MIEVRNNHSAFVRELLGDAYVDQPKPERYVLSPSLDGYEIRERGDLIATFRGPQYERAAKVLRMLKAEARR